jgi:ribosome-binding protein aMBF1 (putative translation factor)
MLVKDIIQMERKKRGISASQLAEIANFQNSVENKPFEL